MRWLRRYLAVTGQLGGEALAPAGALRFIREVVRKRDRTRQARGLADSEKAPR